MFFHLLAIDVDGLFAHDGFEVECHISSLTLLGHREVLAIPGNALIVTATTGLSRHQLYAVRRRDKLPSFVVEILSFSTSHIAQMEAPASVEVPYQSTTILQGEQPSDRGLRTYRAKYKRKNKK